MQHICEHSTYFRLFLSILTCCGIGIKTEDYTNFGLFFLCKSCLYFSVTVLNKVHHIYSGRGSKCGATGMATVPEAVEAPAPL